MNLGGRSGPWSVTDVRFALSAGVVGVVLLAWGWWQSSGTAKVGDAVPGVVLGVMAALAVVAGGLSWVAAGRRAVQARRQEIVARLEESALLGPTRAGDSSVAALVAVAGSSRFHRDDCLLVRGKKVDRLPDGVRRLRRRTPCEMCQP